MDLVKTQPLAVDAGLEKRNGLTWETYPRIHEPELREATGIMPDEKVPGNLPIGYPSVILQAPRLPPELYVCLRDTSPWVHIL